MKKINLMYFKKNSARILISIFFSIIYSVAFLSLMPRKIWLILHIQVTIQKLVFMTSIAFIFSLIHFFITLPAIQRFLSTSGFLNPFVNFVVIISIIFGITFLLFYSNPPYLQPQQHKLVISATGSANTSLFSNKIRILEIRDPKGRVISFQDLEIEPGWVYELYDGLEVLTLDETQTARIITTFTGGEGSDIQVIFAGVKQPGLVEIILDGNKVETDPYDKQGGQRLLSFEVKHYVSFRRIFVDFSLSIFITSLVLILIALNPSKKIPRSFLSLFAKSSTHFYIYIFSLFVGVIAACIYFELSNESGITFLKFITEGIEVYTWIFLFQMVLVSIALGLITLPMRELLFVPNLARFLIGFCSAPFVIGCWVIIVAYIIPGASRYVFLIPPSAVSIAVIILKTREILNLVKNSIRNKKFNAQSMIKNAVIIFCVTFILFLFLPGMTINSVDPIPAHDISIYLSRALYFLKERSTKTMLVTGPFPSHFYGSGSTHNFVWPAYLSFGLMNTNMDYFGYLHDQSAYFAVQVTMFYMFLSAIALANTLKRKWVGAIALLFSFQIPNLDYISRSFSRDGFRIIPILLITTILVGLSKRNLRQKLSSIIFLPVFIISFFVVSGHTIGVMVLGLILIPWVIWVMWKQAHRINVLLILVAISAGTILGTNHNIQMYFDQGMFTGLNYKNSALEGTELEGVTNPQLVLRLKGTENKFDNLMEFFKRDNYRLSLLAVILALLLPILYIFQEKNEITGEILFICIIVILFLLPYSGMFDLRYSKLSISFTINFRYMLHWYLFAAILVSWTILFLYDHIKAKLSSEKFFYVNRIFSILFFLLWIYSISAIDEFWKYPEFTLEPQRINNIIAPLENTIEALPKDKLLLIDERDLNYYLGNQAIEIYSPSSWDIVQAKNPKDIGSAIEKWDIGAIALSNERINGWWDQIPLFNYLNNPNNALTSIHSNDRFRIYLIK